MSIQLIDNTLERIDQILEKSELPDRHTFFQINKFIIGKEPTGQSQLWAIVRELQARKATIEAFRLDLADAEDNLELLDVKIERLNRKLRLYATVEGDPDSDLNISECEINIRKLQRDKESLIRSCRAVNKKLKSTLEEVECLVKGFDEIVSKIGDMKPLDDEEAQREYWSEKYLEEFNLRIILSRPLDPEFVRSVMCLHDDAPVKKHVTSVIENIQQRMLAEKASKRPEVVVKPKISGK